MVTRVAVYGGDGRVLGRGARDQVRHFGSTRRGGNISAQRLEEALRSGRYHALYVLTRWVGHSAVRRLKAICKRYGVEVVEVSGSQLPEGVVGPRC